MTAAVYNVTRDAQIPAAVWTAVLGVSVACHLALLVYGLPIMRSEQAPIPSDTEIVIESEDLFFEAVDTVPSVVSDAAVTESAAVQPITAPSETVTPAPSEEIAPVASDILRPEETATLEAVDVQPDQLTPNTTQAANAVDPEEVETNTAQPLSQAAAELATSVPIETVPVSEPVRVEAAAEQTLTATPPDGIVVLGPSSASQVLETVPESQALEVAPPPQSVVVTPNQQSESATSPNVATSATPVTVTTVGQTTAIAAEVSSSNIAQPVMQNTNSSAVSTVNAATPAVTATPVTSSAVAVQQSSAVNQVTSVAVPSAGATPVENQGGNVQAIKPVEEEVAALQPSETELPSLAPSDPDPSSVPANPISSDPAPNVPPEDVATIDPLADVTAYVANYDIGECAHLTVMSAGTDTAQITAFAAAFAPFLTFNERFIADQGYEATITGTPISNRQCPLLDALDTSNGVEAPGLLDLDRTVVTSGSRVSGVIQRDLPIGRIAQAEKAGLELNGKGPPELYLIDGAGQIHDGRKFVRAETSTAMIGGWRFAIPVTFAANEQSETALILAVWNRPKQNQPAAFGKLPANRIAGVLAKPGVYSLSAFKVSR